MTTPPPYYGPPTGGPVGKPGGQDNTQGLVGMILGIVAIPLVCCFYIGVAAAIAGLIVSWLGLQKANAGRASNRGQAVAGLACSGVALGLAVLLVVLSVVLNAFDWQTWLENNTSTSP